MSVEIVVDDKPTADNPSFLIAYTLDDDGLMDQQITTVLLGESEEEAINRLDECAHRVFGDKSFTTVIVDSVRFSERYRVHSVRRGIDIS